MNIKAIVEEFRTKIGANHRYRSYDYCYNYFYKNRNNILEDMEKSCAILGFYLASWGMMRGSSFLLQKSYKYLESIIGYIARQDDNIWEIDVDNYKENYQTILEMYEIIKEKLVPENKRHIVLVTKVMMGVFGIVPAYDDYFCKTFRDIEPKKSRFSTFNQPSLEVIQKFYESNKFEIDELAHSTFTNDFETGEKKYRYTKAKIIDMYGFTNSLLTS